MFFKFKNLNKFFDLDFQNNIYFLIVGFFSLGALIFFFIYGNIGMNAIKELIELDEITHQELYRIILIFYKMLLVLLTVVVSGIFFLYWLIEKFKKHIAFSKDSI